MGSGPVPGPGGGSFGIRTLGHTTAVTATYRLQLHAGFTFADAAQLVPYLYNLGISALYLSPVLQASRGSQHGYDVVDHSRISAELGGYDGLAELAQTAHHHGLSVVVDVVPNHVSFSGPEHDNPVLWQVLREGRTSPRAHWFDVDWEAGEGRIGVPVLADDLKHEIEAGSLTLDQYADEPVVRYHEHVFPIAEATLSDDLEATLREQHYSLTSWRSDDSLNYRRFFTVTGLIAIRVELDDVFEGSHRLLLDLNHHGVIDGFRIDHPDGLADPVGYLHRLRSAVLPGTPVYVEKILEGEERLPDDWPVEGTTGYDATRAVDLALADPTSVGALDAAWATTGGEAELESVVGASKRYVVHDLLRPEVSRLTRRAAEAMPDLDPDRLRLAVQELLAAGEVYRGYAGETAGERSAYWRTIQEAVARARLVAPDLATELHALGEIAFAPDGNAASDFAARLQQTWSAVMAKSVEDTAFYRWHRLVALNEVGGDPGVLRDASAETLHAWATHQQASWPDGLTALSTHDTKRSEDLRARILAVAADRESWAGLSATFARAADEHQVDRATAHLLWQTLVGAGDISRERLHDYLTKAAREAAQHTSWTDPEPRYEAAVLALADSARTDKAMLAQVDKAVSANAHRVRAMVLGQKALQLLLPGVPDLYQGTELVDLSLVDPDNRRPVDYAVRRERLARLATQEPRDLDDEKLLVVTRALALRNRLPDVFARGSAYTPLAGDATVGQDAPVLGFVRGGRVAGVVTRAVHDGTWSDEQIELPDGSWRDELTGAAVSSPVECKSLFARYPVALLVLDQ